MSSMVERRLAWAGDYLFLLPGLIPNDFRVRYRNLIPAKGLEYQNIKMMIQRAVNQHYRALIGFVPQVGKCFRVRGDGPRTRFDQAEHKTGIVFPRQILNQARYRRFGKPLEVVAILGDLVVQACLPDGF